MCTSTASKPARSNAAAISTWPLTPCSRRIATRGRAPVLMIRRGDVLAASKLSFGVRPGVVEVAARGAFLVGAFGVVAQLLHGVRHRPPGVEQLLPAPLGQRLRARRSTRTTGAAIGLAMRCAQSVRLVAR